ncbi:TrkA family potassium uptake protein [Clostridium sp. JN-9]|uniref:potassium channel family protein n=1 Tax=Clostridium sp. JN-9 TaxID=2507159 RepID=UPI000FFE3308|nr:TrkA family potassium uptake protein [Clostridium sp. JN-9]QAT41078.1 TrkA family potassium uptake protein [Clostridium sp. JN-9]
MSKKQFVVIGIGRFGSSLAKTLYALGNDVLAVDIDEETVQNISESVTHAVQIDATDENSLRALGISNFDVAVITIGEDIQASIMTTLLIKEIGVKYIIAKANNELQAKVLYKIGADRVVLPERDMGVRVAHNLVSSSILDYIELSPDYSIAEVVAPKDWHNRSLKELSMRSNYGVNVVAIKHDGDINASPNAEDVVEPGDIIVAIGGTEELSKIEDMFTK